MWKEYDLLSNSGTILLRKKFDSDQSAIREAAKIDEVVEVWRHDPMYDSMVWSDLWSN